VDNAVANNEIYVLLCESVQAMEPQIQHLHSVLASLRTLSAKLRYLAASDGAGGGESSFHLPGAPVASAVVDNTTKLKKSAFSGARDDLEAPELASIIPVRH
jgi:hypothetical protein